MLGSLPMATEISPSEDGEAEGCVQCQKGSKLVLFVTGKCHWGCDYCPLSDNRRESPDMFANERRCQDWSEVIEEARAMNATGTGITGGDPMLDMEKSLEAIKQLKSALVPRTIFICTPLYRLILLTACVLRTLVWMKSVSTSWMEVLKDISK